MQALGYYLNITPRFVNVPYPRLGANNPVEKYISAMSERLLSDADDQN